MENNTKNFSDNNSDNEESKKIVNNFKNELEKLKQKLSKDFYKYSQIEKGKNKNINFHYINNNNINEPNKNEQNYNELKEDIKIATENIESIINKTEEKGEKITAETKTNSNVSFLTKIPSFEELKMKYGINLNNKPSSIKDISIETNFNKFNKGKDKNFNFQKNCITENNNLSKIKSFENNNNIDDKPSYIDNDIIKQNNVNKEIENNINNINNINNVNNLQLSSNKKNEIKNFNNNINNNESIDDVKKYDYINLLNLKKDAEDEINNIIKKRELLDLSDNSDDDKKDIDNSKDEIKLNNKEKNIQEKEIINKDDEDEKELEMINKYIEDDKTTNNNNINISIFKNINNNNNNNNNNISYFSNISNINNINNPENQRQFNFDIGQLDNNELNDVKIGKNINNKNTNDKNIVCKTNINDNDNINIDLEKENKSRLITYESPIKTGINSNNNNNNNSVVDASMLNSKFEQQIKLINEKSEDNRIQEEKNLLKLKEIENSLKFDKRIKHENREIRKNAIKELCEICTNLNSDEDEKEKVFECCSQWIKDCLEETNSYVIPESLNFFIIFNSLFPNFLPSSMKDFYDNIERYVNFGISSINEKKFS